MPEPIEFDDIRTGASAIQFEGGKYGSPTSFFVTSHPPGAGPGLHRHPYEETFIVQRGVAEFTVDESTLRAHAGQIVVVPAGTVHRFENVGEEPLDQVSIHPVPEMETEWFS